MAQENQQQPQTSMLEYPIVDPIVNAPMKAIPLQNLPTFHGLISWGHWKLDQLLDTLAWRSGFVVDLVVPFDRKCAKKFQEVLDPGILFEIVDYLVFQGI